MIALAAKNAILIVEFARDLAAQGMGRIEVHRKLPNDQRNKDTYKSGRYYQDNCNRIGPALVLRREDQVNQRDRQRKDEIGLTASLLFLIGKSGPFVTHNGRSRRGSNSPALPADTYDLDRIYSGRGSAVDRHRRRRREPAVTRYRSLRRNARFDSSRDPLRAGLLCLRAPHFWTAISACRSTRRLAPGASCAGELTSEFISISSRTPVGTENLVRMTEGVSCASGGRNVCVPDQAPARRTIPIEITGETR